MISLMNARLKINNNYVYTLLFSRHSEEITTTMQEIEFFLSGNDEIVEFYFFDKGYCQKCYINFSCPLCLLDHMLVERPS